MSQRVVLVKYIGLTEEIVVVGVFVSERAALAHVTFIGDKPATGAYAYTTHRVESYP